MHFTVLRRYVINVIPWPRGGSGLEMATQKCTAVNDHHQESRARTDISEEVKILATYWGEIYLVSANKY